jgi:hypothetical protein
MKKILLLGLIIAIVLSFSSIAFARGSSPVLDCRSTWETCTVDDDSVLFDWSWDLEMCEPDPTKYSVDVEMLIDGESFDDPLAVIQKISFGTGDESNPAATALDVPLTSITYWDGYDFIPFVGDARARVKGLRPPGKSQNNPFSDYCFFVIE